MAAARKRAATPMRAFAPLDTAELCDCVAEGAAEDEDALEEAPEPAGFVLLAAGTDAEPVPEAEDESDADVAVGVEEEAVIVTPTASQSWRDAASAEAASVAEQAASMHWVVAATYC